MNRLELKQYIAETYGIEPDCPWIKNPNFEVYRHSNNKKWFALIMDIPRYRIGLISAKLVVLVITFSLASVTSIRFPHAS